MRFILTPILLLYSTLLAAQFHETTRNSHSDFQFGVSAKATLELKRKEPHLRLAISSGIGHPLRNYSFYPALNVEWQLYYGGFGTMSGSQKKDKYTGSEIIGSLMLTTGSGYRRQPSYAPLYYLTDMAQPSLLNPYHNFSFSIARNVVIPLDGKALQVVGYLNVHYRYFQLGYYNDGGGLQKVLLGDGEDRYYTGGGFIAVTLPRSNVINTFTASYHKYTGFSANAFDISNEMNIGNVYYKNPEEQYYNRSFWNFSAGSTKYGLSAFCQLNNPMYRADFQNIIHYIGNYGYHQIPYPRYKSFGLTYFYSQHQISVK
ncbi:hypothetical protein [Chitinophaga pinensis]|uniref:Bacterial toxin 23 domain-containing protein n=1 Tax=Chitinophaga pinensis TaxID=79329 RepID=A0A5C6LM18_9BACT|nr:hypothetical protein [Chitinophaga pinensis]TWV95122.1 hypothetical protein FEF09_24965 [Chitinophaga pinensis]